MKPHPVMTEGPEVFDRFKRAVQAVLKVKESDMLLSPSGKSGKRRKPDPKVSLGSAHPRSGPSGTQRVS
jgi:hypothetical protein